MSLSSATDELAGLPPRPRIGVLPGVWPPHHDAWMLADVMLERGLAAGRDVLELFTGSGAIAVSAALGGARSVAASDISRRSLLTVRLNAMANGVRVRTIRSDLFDRLGARTFDLIVANPPYIPGEEALPSRGLARAWEGGPDGRLLLDRLCTEAPEHLRDGGRLLVVHSSMNDEGKTRSQLEERGLRTEVVVRHRGPLGAVSQARAEVLRSRGLIGAVDELEETLVISAMRS